MSNNKKKPDYDRMFKEVRSRLYEVIKGDHNEFESDLFKKDMSDPNMCDGELGVYSVDYVKTIEIMNRTLEAQVDSYKKKVGK